MYSDNILDSKIQTLTEKQKKAISFYKGVLLLLAVPGSGKTTSIIYRNANLILKQNVEPDRICNITFSKAAALEMELRFKKTFPELEKVPYFSTIHSLGFKIVREYLNSKNIPFVFIEGNQNINKFGIIKNIVYNTNKEYPKDETLEQVITFISLVRNSLIDFNKPNEKINELITKTKEKFDNPVEIYQQYMNLKRENNWIDFDDMLCIANNILSTNHPVSEKFKNKFSFIQVDEAQDLSLVQYEIAIKLSSYNQNLCLVGDDDQNINAFRGSNPSILLNFKNAFPTTTVIYMEQNFRSTSQIVNNCNEFIKGNRNRYPKNMFTENNFKGHIEVSKYNTIIEQAKSIITEIKENNNFSNTAVLYRNNASALIIVIECLNQKVPFDIKIPKNTLFKQFILDDLVAFNEFANDRTDKKAFLQIAYKINMIFIKKQELEKTINNTKEEDLLNALKSTNIDTYTLTNLKMQLNHLKNCKNATKFLDIIFEELNYTKYLQKKDSEDSIDILYAIAQDKINIEDVILELTNLSEKVNDNNINKSNTNEVKLSTLHSSKGLEWEDVYLIDFTDNIIPSPNSNLEEERRLAYVGFSRAIRHLNISYYLKGYTKLESSRFITEFLPKEKNNKKEFSDIELHDKITHVKFGPGYVVDKDDNLLTINFDKYGIKKINKKMAQEKNLIASYI